MTVLAIGAFSPMYVVLLTVNLLVASYTLLRQTAIEPSDCQ